MRFLEFKQSIKEDQEVSYDNWDHDYPVEYSQYLEKTFGNYSRVLVPGVPVCV